MTKPTAVLAFAAVALALGLTGCSTGTDGCNRLVGTWSMSGDAVEFGTFASNLMACEGVDTWLGGASTATVAGSTMTIQDADGDELGTLERAD